MTFENEIERVVKITAADHLMNFYMRGTMAYATPDGVTLPTPHVYEHLGRDAKRMIHGLADHEVAHKRFTDFEVMAACRKDEGSILHTLRRYPHINEEHLRDLGGEVLAMTYNSVEDGWIERKHGADYPGAAENMHQKNRWFLERPDPRAPKPTELWTRFQLAFTLVARGSAEIDIYDTIGRYPDPEVYEMLKASRLLLMQLEEAQDSGDCLAIAIKLMRLFDVDSREEDKPKPPGSTPGGPEDREDEGTAPSEPSSGSPGSSDEEGEGEDESEGAGGSEGEEGEEDEETSSGETEEASEDEEGEESKAEGAEDWEAAGKHAMKLREHKPSGEPATPEGAIEKILGKILDDPGPYIVFSHEWDLEVDFSSEDLSSYSSEWSSTLSEAEQASDVLAQAFEVALRARRQKEFSSGHDEGVVDIGLLGEYSVGAVNADEIYLREQAIDDREVAVAILIDCSGSMGGCVPGSRSYLARLTATAMHVALARCQIAHEITGFTSCFSGDRGHPWVSGSFQRVVSRNFSGVRRALAEEQKRGRSLKKYARTVLGYGPNDRLQLPIHAIFKNFDSDDARGLVRVQGIYENLDGEAVMWQARRLTTRPEPRRIMFVLSDGRPLGSRSTAQGARYLKESIKRVIAAGIECYGIGIQSTHVKSYYPKHWVARNLSDLCSVAMGSMIEVLTEARQEHQWVQLTG